jgi:hypothetical protein
MSENAPAADPTIEIPSSHKATKRKEKREKKLEKLKGDGASPTSTSTSTSTPVVVATEPPAQSKKRCRHWVSGKAVGKKRGQHGGRQPRTHRARRQFATVAEPVCTNGQAKPHTTSTPTPMPLVVPSIQGPTGPASVNNEPDTGWREIVEDGLLYTAQDRALVGAAQTAECNGVGDGHDFLDSVDTTSDVMAEDPGGEFDGDGRWDGLTDTQRRNRFLKRLRRRGGQGADSSAEAEVTVTAAT